ncbi:hypothetical protein [Methylorubrum sp. POS3]|uniref:hypothetical protein n=1 Tax=Methylorubrum sp. POS3 TaxID=2998492 RepID=UPI00372C3A88
MADMTKLRSAATAGGLPAPPKPAEVLGNVKGPSHAELERQRREERGRAEAEERARVEAEDAARAEAAEAATEKKRAKGRPKLDYSTRQLGARVRSDTFDRVTAISRRERVGLGPLVDRMVREWERMRLEQAAAMGPRLEGEDDDAYIARVFRL